MIETISDFINKHGKYLMLSNFEDKCNRYNTVFVANNKNKTASSIIEIITELGEVSDLKESDSYLTFVTKNGVYVLFDYTNGVIES